MSIGLARGGFTACIGIFLLAFVGCATTFKQDVLITSTLTQAEVVVKNSEEVEVFRGITPAIVEIPRKGDYSVFVSLPDYKEQRSFVSKDNSLFVSVVRQDTYRSDCGGGGSGNGSSGSDCGDCGDCGNGSSGSDCGDCGNGSSGSDCSCNSVSGIGRVGFGLNRLISPLGNLSPDHIAINLVTALSDQNTNEPYAVFHTLQDGDVRTLTVPLIRQ